MTLAKDKPKANPAANRYLTVMLGRECYALSALNVREIIRPVEISPVPRSPEHVLGVINLRGKIVPVLDMRLRFDLAFTGRTPRTSIVVVQTALGQGPGGLRFTGLMVDEACEVLTLNEIEDAPDFGAAVDHSFLRGLAKVKEAVVIILDLERLMAEGKLEINPANP